MDVRSRGQRDKQGSFVLQKTLMSGAASYSDSVGADLSLEMCVAKRKQLKSRKLCEKSKGMGCML